MARLGTVLIVLGLVALAYAGLWQLGLAPGSRVSLPPPVALRAPPEPIPTPTLMPAMPQAIPTSTLAPATPEPRVTAEAIDSRVAEPTLDPAPGYAVRLAIPSIKLDTPVQQAGVVNDSSGNPIWETLPFVAVHYGDLTARIGEQGNAVIAGHVVTLNEGNVFRFLYQLDFDDTIEVWTEHDVKARFSRNRRQARTPNGRLSHGTYPRPDPDPDHLRRHVRPRPPRVFRAAHRDRQTRKLVN